MTRSPISACTIVAPAPIAQSRPMRDAGPDHGAGSDHACRRRFRRRGPITASRIDRDAGLKPRRRMHQRVGRNARSSRTARTAAAPRETARAPPQRRPDRARARPARQACRAPARQIAAPSGRRRRASVANCVEIFGIVEKREVGRTARDQAARYRRCAGRAHRRLRLGAGQRGDLADRQARGRSKEYRHSARPVWSCGRDQNLVPPPNRNH